MLRVIRTDEKITKRVPDPLSSLSFPLSRNAILAVLLVIILISELVGSTTMLAATSVTPVSQPLVCGVNTVTTPDVWLTGNEGDTFLLAELTVGASLQGTTVDVLAETTNNSSLHPRTQYIVSSGTTSITLDNVEGWVGKITTVAGQLILGNLIEVTVKLGGDEQTSSGGTVTITVDCPTPPAAPQLIVNKIVVNDNGGTKVISDFSLFIDGVSVTSGVASTTAVGLHTVSETADSSYTTTIGGDCVVDGTITLALGDVKTCTITNDDIAPVVAPVVVPPPSSGGGGSSYTPLPPLIDVVKVPNPLALPGGPGTVTYTYTLRNIGTVTMSGITMVGDSCSPINFISGDSNNNARLEVSETWVYQCSTTLSQTHTNIVTATGWANGITATDIASATVVVGVPLVPPLVHVTKVPSPLVLPSGGGTVTYTYTVTNPGTAPLSNVSIADDKCTGLPGRVAGHPGDLNQNNLLESNEAWQFTCQSNLTQTTTNTGTASGSANGLTATDFAIATVVVSPAVVATIVPKLPTAVVVTVVPKLPTAGFAPSEDTTPWNIVEWISGSGTFFLFLYKQNNTTSYHYYDSDSFR